MTLHTLIQELTRRYKGRLPETPRVVELNEVQHDNRGRPIVQRASLQTVEDYTLRFNELLNAGYPWINLTYLGRLDGMDIVGIELPTNSLSRMAAGQTSINYSGPPKLVSDAGGDASTYIVLKE